MAAPADPGKLDRLVAGARRARSFAGPTLRELAVHHKDGNHDNNAPDGSNWELLCIYCHENEHARILDEAGRGTAKAADAATSATHKPFADLQSLLRSKK